MVNDEKPPSKVGRARERYNRAQARKADGPMATSLRPPDAPTESPTPHQARPTEARPSKTRQRIQDRFEDRQLPKVDWTWLVIGGAVFGVVALVALIMFSAFGGSGSSPAAPATLPGGTAVSIVRPDQLPTPNIKPWDGKSRVTILLLGLDKRPGEQGSSFRTDTIILLSLDTPNKTIGMLSIPRDTFVPIPDQPEMQPINTAYVLGELKQPGAGPALVSRTIEYNLGMRIDYYVVVEFSAVINLVDAIGGVDINVPQTIDDKEYPAMNTNGFDPLYIPAGPAHMDGTLALKYARTRHGDSDFDRTGRQQQVIMAIRKKALRVDMLPELVSKAPLIWNEVSRGVKTNLQFDQILSLGWTAKDITDANIHRGAVTNEYLQAIQYKGKAIVTINRNTISKLMQETFGASYNQ